jgi:hypothetical protein
MVEKEVLHDDERPRVASVIYNRLRMNMPLQIDATVLYGMGLWKERVLYKDLRHESPYNTYLRRGLPPGPIASPGLASIRAALEPEQTEYLFYVAQANGYHRFSNCSQHDTRLSVIPIAEPEFANSCACRIPPLPALSPLVKGGEGREWGDSARAGICELWLGDWYKSSALRGGGGSQR